MKLNNWAYKHKNTFSIAVSTYLNTHISILKEVLERTEPTEEKTTSDKYRN